MPTYQYACTQCDYIFEKFAPITEYTKETECPVCGQTARLKISGGNGLIFKGSGFYVTDYVKKNKDHNNGNGKKNPDSKTKPTESDSSK